MSSQAWNSSGLSEILSIIWSYYNKFLIMYFLMISCDMLNTLGFLVSESYKQALVRANFKPSWNILEACLKNTWTIPLNKMKKENNKLELSCDKLRSSWGYIYHARNWVRQKVKIEVIFHWRNNWGCLSFENSKFVFKIRSAELVEQAILTWFCCKRLFWYFPGWVGSAKE